MTNSSFATFVIIGIHNGLPQGALPGPLCLTLGLGCLCLAYIQGQKYPVRDPDIEMTEAKAGDMDDERDPCGEPEPPSRVIPPEDG